MQETPVVQSTSVHIEDRIPEGAEDTRSQVNYKGLARVALFMLIAELLLGTKLPTALHLLVSWGLSGLLLFGIFKGTAHNDDQRERKQRRLWGMTLLLVPALLLALGYSIQSLWLVSAAGGALATPGLFGIVLLLFAQPFRQSRPEMMSLSKPARRDRR
jgi:hypothetical protein